MRKVLHILTRENDADVDAVMSHQRTLPDYKLETVDLAAGRPDYAGLLEKVFAADSVTVW